MNWLRLGWVVLALGCAPPDSAMPSGGGSGDSDGGAGDGSTTPTVGTGDGSTTSPLGTDESSSGGIPECAPTNDEARFAAGLRPCTTAACDSSDAQLWQRYISYDEDVEDAYELRCTVEAQEQLPDGETKWVFSACTGEQVPSSGAVGLTVGADELPPIEVGGDVLLSVYRSQQAYAWNEHISWAIRADDGSLLLLHSWGFYLPPSSISDPLELSGSPQECLRDGPCGGVTAPMEVTVSLDGVATTVPHLNTATIGTDPAFFVVLERADYGAGSQCGMHGNWRKYKLLIVG